MVLLALTVLAILSTALLMAANSSSAANRGSREVTSALYVAEAALSEAVVDIANGGTGAIGTPAQPTSFGGASYWVQSTDVGGGNTALSAFGVDKRTAAQLEMVVNESTNSIFQWAAFGDEDLDMDSNAFVDSYDSGAGTYASQATNSSNGEIHAGNDGDVASNGNVTLQSNAMVVGDATCGPSSSTSVTGNAVVTGSTAPASSTSPMPPLVVPSYPSSGSLIVSGSSSYSLPAGNYHFDELRLDSNANLDITGPCTIVCGSMEVKSNAELLFDATGGPLEIYVIDDFILNSNTMISSTKKTPSDIRLFLESDNVIDPMLDVDLDEVDFESNAKLFGVLFAPNAIVQINSNFELFGSIVARSVELDSNARVHYDEALGQADILSKIVVDDVMWRVVRVGPAKQVLAGIPGAPSY